MSSWDRMVAWGEANPEKIRASRRKSDSRPERKSYKKALQKRKSDYIWGVKCASKCVDCGYDNPRALQFDHRLGSIKLFIIGTSGGDRSIEKIKREIDKCDVRCANCHHIRTHQHWHQYRSKN